jgi:hypothetical protein
VKNTAACVVARPGNSRWLVSPTGSIPQAQGDYSSEPTASASESNGEDASLVSNLSGTCSAILFKNGKESEAANTGERRTVCYTSEYEASRGELFARERHYVRVWLALAAVWLTILAGLVVTGLHAPYSEDGQMHGGFIATLTVGGFVQLIGAVTLLAAPIV